MRSGRGCSRGFFFVRVCCVQVNVSLKAPVPVGAVLRVTGRVAKRAGRKRHIHAVLDDGGGAGAKVYAVLEGLSIAGVKLSDADDAVARRTWVDCDGGGQGGRDRAVRQDSGWALAS